MPVTEFYGTGRRKTSSARVFLRPGKGTVTVNRREFDAFFPTEALRTEIRQPLLLTQTVEQFDVVATVATTSKRSAVSVSSSGCLIWVRRASVGKNALNSR